MPTSSRCSSAGRKVRSCNFAKNGKSKGCSRAAKALRSCGRTTRRKPSSSRRSSIATALPIFSPPRPSPSVASIPTVFATPVKRSKGRRRTMFLDGRKGVTYDPSQYVPRDKTNADLHNLCSDDNIPGLRPLSTRNRRPATRLIAQI